MPHSLDALMQLISSQALSGFLGIWLAIKEHVDTCGMAPKPQRAGG
jgi:hypothetical protein